MSVTDHRTDFFVIGVVKGGTTSLYDYLTQHPEIYLPPIKEINHFSQADIDSTHFLPGYARDVNLDLAKYFAKGMPEMIHIAHVNSPQDYAQLYAPAEPHQVKGDISNSYMICPSSAAAIAQHNPKAKAIAVLRNPIKRAWSQYLMNLREAKSEASDIISDIQADSSATHQGWGVNHQYLELGMYHGQLQRYYDHFPAENIHVVIFEEYVREPRTALRKICEFLDVDPSIEFDTSAQKNKASLPRNATLNRLLVNSGAIEMAKKLVPRKLRGKAASVLYSDKGLPEIQAHEVAWLRERYESEVKELSALMQRDLSEVWTEFRAG